MKKFRLILYPVSLVILIVAGWNLYKLNESSQQSAELYEAISNVVHVAEETIENESEKQINTGILVLQEQNSDTIGWLNIEGTNIDYPVMQTKNDPEYYLHHNFKKEESRYGTPFMEAACDLDTSDNLVIYGHNMKDKTMFAGLTAFLNADFCEHNGKIRLMTVSETMDFCPVVVMVISGKEAEKFPYYSCIKLSSEEVYDGFLSRCGQYAVWQSEEKPQLGDRLITLSTCEYTKENGRLVVIAAAK